MRSTHLYAGKGALGGLHPSRFAPSAPEENWAGIDPRIPRPILPHLLALRALAKARLDPWQHPASSGSVRLFVNIGLMVLVVCSIACGAAQGPKVRVATATRAELQAAEAEDSVWYEFQPGDMVPVQFGFLGAVEGGTDGPAVLRAKQQFYLVTTKQGPMRLSFDGKSFVGGNSMQAIIAPVPRKDGKGGALVWVVYMGESGDAQGELDKILAESE